MCDFTQFQFFFLFVELFLDFLCVVLPLRIIVAACRVATDYLIEYGNGEMR